jgi:hypothetical protein
MKKLFYVVIAALVAISVIGGGIYTFSYPARSTTKIGEATPMKSTTKSNVLVIYFAGDKDLEKMAQAISEKTDGDLLKVSLVGKNASRNINNTKSLSYNFTNNINSEVVKDFYDYNVVYYGTPSGWSKNSKPLKLLAERFKFKDQDLIPFGTSKLTLTDLTSTRKDSKLTDEITRCVY